MTEQFTPTWRIRCGHCNYSRGYGTAPLAASHAARKHHDKMGHDVMVIRNGQVEYTLAGNGHAIARTNGDHLGARFFLRSLPHVTGTVLGWTEQGDVIADYDDGVLVFEPVTISDMVLLCENVDIFGNICTRPAIHDGRHVSRAMSRVMHVAKSVW